MQNAMTVREESEEKLEMLARSRGLSVVPILGDGNCLFNAVLESAGERGMSAAELRDQAVNAAWHQALSAGVDGPFTVVDGHGEKSVSHELLAQWADDMRRDAVHVDEIAIRGVAGALGKTI